jgi:hypothetical protein
MCVRVCVGSFVRRDVWPCLELLAKAGLSDEEATKVPPHLPRVPAPPCHTHPSECPLVGEGTVLLLRVAAHVGQAGQRRAPLAARQPRTSASPPLFLFSRQRLNAPFISDVGRNLAARQVVHGFAQTHYSCFLDVMTTIIRTTPLPPPRGASLSLSPEGVAHHPFGGGGTEIFGPTKEFADSLGAILNTMGQSAFAFLQKGAWP